MANQIFDYILCADESSLADAITAIQPASVLALDCEGKYLGVEGGTLSLINLRALEPETSKIYLIDTVSLTKDQLGPIFDIIQSFSVTKIVFDGRMDFSELYHGWSVSLRGVFDLQLADVDSRRQRGEGEEEQLFRLSPYLHRREISGQPGSYSAVHKLCGLDQCVKEHGIVTAELETNKPGEDIFNVYSCQKYTDVPSEVTHRDWLKRPLPELYLRYSSRDVYLIGILYAHFKEQGYINNDRLSAQSARYLSISQNAKPRATDIFKKHPLLPLHILDYNDYALTRACIGCTRPLPEAAYPKSGWKQAKKRQCWVCRAISVRREIHDNWGREEYDDWETEQYDDWERQWYDDWDGEENDDSENFNLDNEEDYGWYRGEDYDCYDSDY
jgi:exonuclease 3'-5' domain-containing protein 1